MSASMVYLTAGSRDEALAIGRQLVAERLAASVNVFDSIHSVYHWQGKVEESDEAVLVAKTRSELVEPLMARAAELHSYDCPGIVSWPIVAGHPPYLDWITSETTEPAG